MNINIENISKENITYEFERMLIDICNLADKYHWFLEDANYKQSCNKCYEPYTTELTLRLQKDEAKCWATTPDCSICQSR